jgi:hypothetical protein
MPQPYVLAASQKKLRNGEKHLVVVVERLSIITKIGIEFLIYVNLALKEKEINGKVKAVIIAELL